MADLSDINSAETVKIVGSDSTGVEQTPVQSTANGAIHTNLRDNSGTEIATSSAPLRIDPTGTTTQPVSATSLPLPTGASTSALQNTGNTSLASIDTKTPALGQALAAASVPVVLTAAQITTLTPLSSVTVTQSTGTNLHVVVDSGSITANAGTNLNTSALALESGGNLATIKTNTDNLALAQASTTSGQKGNLILGATTTSAPTYITAQSNPLSLTTAGALRTDSSATTQPISAAALPLPTGAATSALQTTGNSSLSSIDTKIPANLTVTSTRLLVDGSGVTQPVSGTVTSNIGTTNGLALDATLTGGTQKAIVRGGAKGTTVAADVTSTASGANHQILDVAIYDASGNQITTFGGGTQFADGAARGTATGTLAMGDDGTNIQSISVDTTGKLNLNNISGTISLPTGASTSALQTTGNTSLSSIDTKVPSGLTVTSTRLLTDGSGVTQPISASALPLPTGAATAALQTTGNTSLSSIDTKTPALGQALAAASVPVVLTAAQLTTLTPLSSISVSNFPATQPISATSLPLPTGAATETTLSALNTKVPSGLTVTSTRLLVDGSGVTQPISVASLPLPTGAATETTLAKLAQTQGSTTSGQSGTLMQGAVTTTAPTYTTGQTNPLSLTTAGALRTDSSAVIQPVSAASLPLPTGAATSALQTTGNSSLASIDAGIPAALGQTTMANSMPVTLASDQSALPVKLQDGAGTVLTSTNNAGKQSLDVNVTSSITVSGSPDKTAFTYGTTNQQTVGGVFQDTSPTLTAGQEGAVRVTANRALHNNLRDSSGNELLGSKVSAASVPVVIASDQTLVAKIANYQYSTYSPDPTTYAIAPNVTLAIDASKRLETHSTVLTDEGSFRDDFSGTTLNNTLTGTLSFTNAGFIINGTGTLFTQEVEIGKWIKKSTDSETLFVQVASVNSDTVLTTESAYTGTTQSGVAGVINNWLTATGTGSITVANSIVTLGSGTVSGSTTSILRNADYLPIITQVYAAISQRIANQTAILGFVDRYPSTNIGAYVQFTGTNNTQVNLVTQSSSAAVDTQTTTVTLPNGGNTSTYHTYKIDISSNQVTLLIDGVIVATSTLHIPGPYDVLQHTAAITNSAVVTNTNLTVDSNYFVNTDRIQIDNDFGGEPLGVNGSVPSGSIDSSNPIKIGGKFNTTQPTVTTGQLVDIQTTARGALIVATGVDPLTISGTVTAANASVSTTGSAPPASATYVGASVTTTAPTYTTGQMSALSLTTTGALRTDSSAITQPISATSLPLPTGAATSALQTTGNTSLSSIDTKVPTGLTVTSTRLLTDGSGVTQPISAASLPLPTGAATGALQTTGNTSLATIVTNTTGVVVAQASTTAGQSGQLVQGAVTTTAPTYTTAQTSPLSLTTSGALRTDSSGTTQPISGTITVTQATAANLNAHVEGQAASGTTKAGNPVQIGGVFNTTQPTVTTGQVVETQATARGALIVSTGVDNFNINNIAGTVSLPTGAATSALQTTGNTSLATIANTVGSTAGGTAGTQSAQIGGVFNTTLPTLTTGQQASAQFDVNGRLIVSSAHIDGYKKTYSASIVGLVPATTPTDIFTITGSATTTVKITRIFITGTQTTAAQRDILLIKRSTANTGGTSTAPTRIPYDANDAAATATVLAYTANPTLGTAIGTLFSKKLQISTTALAGSELNLDFGSNSAKAITLRGIAQVLAVNLNSVTSAGNLFDITIEWTEE